jgi:hypothetical protein
VTIVDRRQGYAGISPPPPLLPGLSFYLQYLLYIFSFNLEEAFFVSCFFFDALTFRLAACFLLLTLVWSETRSFRGRGMLRGQEPC